MIMTINGVEKRCIEPYGNALIATRTFVAGDIVLCEKPLITTTENLTLLDEIYDAHKELGVRADLLGKDASIDFTLQMLQFAAASAQVRGFVFELFTPDVKVYKDAPYVRAARQYAEQLDAARKSRPETFARSVLGPLAACSDANEVIRVVLAWVCNCYSTRHGGGALYKVGSLVNHCCEGNTRYRFVDDAEGNGCGVFVACRKINPGEVITTCYLGWDEQTLLSTRMRQKLLVQTKLFTCTCSRCSSSRDPYRSLPCPSCHGGDTGVAGAGSPATSPITATVTTATSNGTASAAAAALPECLGVAAVAEDALGMPTNSGGGDEEEGAHGCAGSAHALVGLPVSPSSRSPSPEGPDAIPPDRSNEGSPSGGAVAARSGFVYWMGATGNGVLSDTRETYHGSCGDSGSGGEGAFANGEGGNNVGRDGHGDGDGDGGRGDMQEAVGQSFWECDTCRKRYCDVEMQGQLRRRAAAADLEAEVSNDDPELALEEEVQRMGEHLDWSELAVSLGAVRRLGARCQAVLGQRHWTTNRCRYTVLELCTAALIRTCAASRTAASAYSGAALRRPDVSLGGGSWCSAGGSGGCGDGGCGTVGWRAGTSSAGCAGACPLPPAATVAATVAATAAATAAAAAAPAGTAGSVATWTSPCREGCGVNSAADGTEDGVSSSPLPPPLPPPPPAHPSTIAKARRVLLETAAMAVATTTGQQGPADKQLTPGDFESALEAAHAAAAECATGNMDIARVARCGRVAAVGECWLGAVTTSLGALGLRSDAPETGSTADVNVAALTARAFTAAAAAATATTAEVARGGGGGELGEAVPDLNSSSPSTTREGSPAFPQRLMAPPDTAGNPPGASCPDNGSVRKGLEEAVVADAASGDVGREAQEGLGMGPTMEATVKVGAIQEWRDDTATSLEHPEHPPVPSPPDPAPHVNPHLGRAALLQHTFHHQSLHQQVRRLSHHMSLFLDSDHGGSNSAGGGCGGSGGPRSAPRAGDDGFPSESTHSSPSGEGAGASAASPDAAVATVAAAVAAIACEDGVEKQQPTGTAGMGNGMGTWAANLMPALPPQNSSVAPGSHMEGVGVSEGDPALPNTVAPLVAAPPTRDLLSGMSLPRQTLPRGEGEEVLRSPTQQQQQQQQDGPQPLTAAPAALLDSRDMLVEVEAGAGVMHDGLVLVSEAGAARSAGGSTLWSLLEVDGLVDCMCEELQALWQWQQHHTPHAPELVLKAVAGPAATALMDVVKDELCSCGQLSSRALTTAEATAARLAAAYEAAPYYDVSGEAYEEAVSVMQLVPLIRKVLDLPE